MIYSLMFPVNIFALPQGGQVVGGQANISVPNAALMQINQLSNKAIIDWNSFSIAHPELVQFMQPGANSIALNKVLGGDPSQIFGTLSANGGVWLINPAGILVGSTGVINVNSLLLSTLDINNEDFLSGNYVFNQMLNTTLASIVNQGTITAAQGGHVSLLAPGIVNQGNILANLGTVNLGAGEQATLNFVGNEMISFAIDKAVADKVRGPDGQELENSILNEGLIAAEGGEIVISARNAYDAIKSVVNNKGIIEAQTIGNINGTIVLDGGEKGIVYNSGTLDVSGMDAGETGGEIQVTGEKVGLIHYSEFKAMGRKGGGKVYAGGGYQGKDSAIRNAKRTFVGKDAKINADAIDEGDGGEVIVWADETTRAYGTITAKGGAVSGDGGLIETSGKSFLDVSGISINASALNGLNGTWLLDPRNVIIHATDVTMLTYDTGSDPHTFTPAGDTSKILYTDIANSLTNNNVLITTGVDGGQEGNITINAALTINWTTSNTLTLQAANDIDLANGTFTMTDSGGTLALLIGQGATGGTLNTAGGTVSTTGTVTATGGTLNDIFNIEIAGFDTLPYVVCSPNPPKILKNLPRGLGVWI